MRHVACQSLHPLEAFEEVVYFRAQEYANTKAADSSPLPSLVVCPPTLTGHWVDEVEKFCAKEYLNPLHYMGPPTERMRYG